MAAKVQTYKDLARWLKTLSPEQLNAPILATGGADDYGLTDYVFVVELVDRGARTPAGIGRIRGAGFARTGACREATGRRLRCGQRALKEQTMSEKPQKRLVSEEEYAWLMIKRAFLGLASLGFCLLGAWVVLVALAWACWYPLYGLIWGLGSAFPLGVAFCLSRAMKSIKLSMLITTEDADLLPQQETLIRPSDLPPSQQQAELLRAAQHGIETPTEELLRATTNRQGE